jgi:hypothetical protein
MYLVDKTSKETLVRDFDGWTTLSADSVFEQINDKTHEITLCYVENQATRTPQTHEIQYQIIDNLHSLEHRHQQVAEFIKLMKKNREMTRPTHLVSQ